MIVAKELLEGPLFDASLITGCDTGVRDEESPDEDDLALRAFVADANDVPPDVTDALDQFPFPTVVLQRVFRTTAGLPDTDRERPVLGGVSVAASRLHTSSTIFVGTLGAIVSDAGTRRSSTV